MHYNKREFHFFFKQNLGGLDILTGCFGIMENMISLALGLLFVL